jgi:hypothetical protein
MTVQASISCDSGRRPNSEPLQGIALWTWRLPQASRWVVSAHDRQQEARHGTLRCGDGKSPRLGHPG